MLARTPQRGLGQIRPPTLHLGRANGARTHQPGGETDARLVCAIGIRNENGEDVPYCPTLLFVVPVFFKNLVDDFDCVRWLDDLLKRLRISGAMTAINLTKDDTGDAHHLGKLLFSGELRLESCRPVGLEVGAIYCISRKFFTGGSGSQSFVEGDRLSEFGHMM